MANILLFECDSSRAEDLLPLLHAQTEHNFICGLSDDSCFPDALGWCDSCADLCEFSYILSFASEIYEVLSRQYRLEPLKSLSIQDIHLLLKHQYLFLKSTYFSDLPDAALFLNYPHHGYTVIAALICSFNDIPYFSMHQLPCASVFALVPPDSKLKPLTWQYSNRLQPRLLDSSTFDVNELLYTHQVNKYSQDIANGGSFTFLPPPQIRGKKSSLSLITSFSFKPPAYKRLFWNLLINRRLASFNRFLESYEARFSFPQVGSYIYFPMHLQPEMTTSSLGGRIYNDQFLVLELILQLARSLQLRVVIKEHPMQCFSHRNLAAYRNLLADPLVHLAPRSMNSNLLVSRSSLVCTISGTAGVEALYHNKPSICLGAAWYKDLDGVYSSISDFLSDQQDQISQLSLNHPTFKNTRSPKMDFQSQLLDLTRTCWPGSPWENFRKNAFQLDYADNLRTLSTSIAEIVKQVLSTSLKR